MNSGFDSLLRDAEEPQTVSGQIEHVVIFPAWIAIDSAEDVECDTEVLLWDGCEHRIDYVDIDVDTGVCYFANGGEATHYKLLDKPDLGL